MAELIGIAGQIAGIGGIAFGVVLVLYRDIIRKKIFSRLGDVYSYRLLRLITILVWSLAVVGLAAWFWSPKSGPGNQRAELVSLLRNRAAVVHSEMEKHRIPTDEFDKLHKSHIAALSKYNDILAHEIAGQIHDLLIELSLKLTKEEYRAFAQERSTPNSPIIDLDGMGPQIGGLTGSKLFFYELSILPPSPNEVRHEIEIATNAIAKIYDCDASLSTGLCEDKKFANTFDENNVYYITVVPPEGIVKMAEPVGHAILP